jgi:hypothetical protein
VDVTNFDRFARAVATTGSRRGLLRWATGGLVGVLAARLSAKDGAAQTDCQPGTFVNGSTCSPCAAGSFSATTNSATCSPCPVGTYAENVGQVACTTCPGGGTTTGTGSTSSSACTTPPAVCPDGQPQCPGLKGHKAKCCPRDTDCDNSPSGAVNCRKP